MLYSSLVDAALPGDIIRAQAGGYLFLVLAVGEPYTNSIGMRTQEVTFLTADKIDTHDFFLDYFKLVARP